LSGRLAKRLFGVALPLAVLAAAMAGDTARSGTLLENTDLTGATVWVGRPAVGDVAMFAITPLPTAGNQKIEITGVSLRRATDGVRLRGARIYRSADFGDRILLAWQSRNGPEYDPHLRPSTDLIGATLQGPDDHQQFWMVEFGVCRSGDLSISELLFRYRHGSREYQQVVKVRLEIRHVEPGPPCA